MSQFKQEFEILNDTKNVIRGDEPFLAYNRPHIIVNVLDVGSRGSHNIFEGRTDFLGKLKPGDFLAMCRVSQTEITWRDKVVGWVKGILKA
jgi:hypothetical protein